MQPPFSRVRVIELVRKGLTKIRENPEWRTAKLQFQFFGRKVGETGRFLKIKERNGKLRKWIRAAWWCWCQQRPSSKTTPNDTIYLAQYGPKTTTTSSLLKKITLKKCCAAQSIVLQSCPFKCRFVWLFVFLRVFCVVGTFSEKACFGFTFINGLISEFLPDSVLE
jgi:hypothetical protein